MEGTLGTSLEQPHSDTMSTQIPAKARTSTNTDLANFFLPVLSAPCVVDPFLLNGKGTLSTGKSDLSSVNHLELIVLL